MDTTSPFREPRFTARPSTRLRRSRLPEAEIERARRERSDPQVTQWDYLHLSGLKRGILASLRLVPDEAGPVLDLFCGTKPYLDLIPWRPVYGVDLDMHFDRADVLAQPPLPFRDATFGLAFCSQALHLVDDPLATVREMARVVRPAGHAIITIPHLFLAEGSFERRWGAEDLRMLFAEWDDVRIAGIDGPAAAAAFVIGRVAMLAARRFRAIVPLLPPAVVAMNAICAGLDALSKPLHRRWPHSLVLVATRPAKPRVASNPPSRTEPRMGGGDQTSSDTT